MQKKNKIMLASAIAMAAIVVATSAVRCSIAHTAQGQPEAAAETVAEQAAQSPGGRDGSDMPGSQASNDAIGDAMALLQGNVWQSAESPERTVSFREGSFVESDGTSVKIAAFDVKDAGSDGEQAHLDIDLMREGDPYATATTIVVEEQDGALSVACDGFANEKRYVQGSPSGAEVAVAGLAEPYIGLIDGKEGELASALAAWCTAHAPSAASASFDGEVYVDVRGGRVSATFHLDDPAATIVTASYEGGSFSVFG